MSGIILFATPWWVNLLILIPFVPVFLARNQKLHLRRRRLIVAALFAVAFAFVEAAVVVYLRASSGLLFAQRGHAPAAFPDLFLRIEIAREAATMIMLAAIAALAGRSICQRLIAFLWTFAIWDIFYYVFLYITIGWPNSLKNLDLLFLIPVPWISQVWFPLLVSSLTILAVLFYAKKTVIAPALPDDPRLMREEPLFRQPF
jgi:hypothetical protein